MSTNLPLCCLSAMCANPASIVPTRYFGGFACLKKECASILSVDGLFDGSFERHESIRSLNDLLYLCFVLSRSSVGASF